MHKKKQKVDKSKNTAPIKPKKATWWTEGEVTALLKEAMKDKLLLRAVQNKGNKDAKKLAMARVFGKYYILI